MRYVGFNTEHDVAHATRIAVEQRPKDYSGERTDKRPSERYKVYEDKPSAVDLTINFHEGCHPKDGLNGWLLEDLLAICLDRLQQHQAGPFRCRENALAATKVEEALLWMHRRRAARKAAGTSGTQRVD